MNTSLKIFQTNAIGKIVQISRQSSFEPGTKMSQVDTQGCPPKPRMEIVHKKFPIIPHGSQVSHTPNNAPMILRKGSKMVARLPRQRRWPPKFCPNDGRCPGATFSGNRGDLHLTYIAPRWCPKPR